MELAPGGLQDTSDHPPPARRGRLRIRRALRAVLPFVIVAFIIALRFPTHLFRAEFWAEDATEFFFDAVSIGPRSLVVPVYGYHFLLERLIAYGATFLPVFYTPYVYSWSCLLIDAAALAYLARDGFSWIAPRRWQRILLAVLLALGPGTADVLLNLANLPNILALLGFLLLVERPFRMTGARLIGFGLVATSSGHVLLWLPVAAYLSWRIRSRGYAAAAAVVAALAFLNGVGAHGASRSSGSLDFRALAHVPRILLENGFARLLPAPFLGLGPASAFQRAPGGVYWAVAALGLAAFAWLAVRKFALDGDGTVVLLLGYAGAIGMLGLVAITRSYNVPLLVRESGTLLPQVRYSFLPAALATFIWTSWLLSAHPGGSPGRVLRYAAAAIMGIHLAAGFPLRYARPDLAWGQRSEHVQWLLDLNRATGRPVVITMQDLAIHPWRWVPDNGRIAVVVPGR
jgi:hypothetical protein